MGADARGDGSVDVGASTREILSTLFARDAPIPAWLAEAEMLVPRDPTRTVAALLRRARNHRALVLDGSAKRDQVAAALISARRAPPSVVIADATWKAGGNIAERAMNRAGIRAIDGEHVTYCVHSTLEQRTFAQTWGPLKGRIRFTPFAHTLSSASLMLEPGDNGRVFAGGDSLRDYRTLIEAAAGLSVPVEIATRNTKTARGVRVPPNVTIGPAASPDYEGRMRSASLVVVPLEHRADRASGQSTYLNAMAMGKAVIVTDAPGARDYIEDGHTGVLVPAADAGAMTEAIRRLMLDPESRERIGAKARRVVRERFNLENYARSLLAVVHEVLD